MLKSEIVSACNVPLSMMKIQCWLPGPLWPVDIPLLREASGFYNMAENRPVLDQLVTFWWGVGREKKEVGEKEK